MCTIHTLCNANCLVAGSSFNTRHISRYLLLLLQNSAQAAHKYLLLHQYFTYIRQGNVAYFTETLGGLIVLFLLSAIMRSDTHYFTTRQAMCDLTLSGRRFSGKVVEIYLNLAKEGVLI